MQNQYQREQTITAAFSDRRCELGVYRAILLLQDAMTEYFYHNEIDAIHIGPTHGVLWAVARSKIQYDGMPRWMDTVRFRIFPVKVSPVTIHLNMVVETLEGETLLRCRQELCAMDSRDHSLRRVDSTPFPMDLDLLPPVMDAPFRRKKVAVGPEDLAHLHTIRTADTDKNHHMNNAEYVRLIENAFPTDFWDRYRVLDFDIHYVTEGKEGEVLEVFRQQDGNEWAVVIKCGDRTLIKAFLLVEERGEEE